jgi:hypothetical protein
MSQKQQEHRDGYYRSIEHLSLLKFIEIPKGLTIENCLHINEDDLRFSSIVSKKSEIIVNLDNQLLKLEKDKLTLKVLLEFIANNVNKTVLLKYYVLDHLTYDSDSNIICPHIRLQC